MSSSFTIAKGVAALAIDPATLHGTFNGSAHAATVSTTPVGLSVVSITYAGSARPDGRRKLRRRSVTHQPELRRSGCNRDVGDRQGESDEHVGEHADIVFGPCSEARNSMRRPRVWVSVTRRNVHLYAGRGQNAHAGPHTLSVSFAPTDSKNYNSVPATTVQLTVLKADQTIALLHSRRRHTATRHSR